MARHTLPFVLMLATGALSAPQHPGRPKPRDPFALSPGFDIRKVTEVAEVTSAHSWEFGAMSQALLEVFDPDHSVFGEHPWPKKLLKKSDVKALSYADSKIVLGPYGNSLSDGAGSSADPASLGVYAVMLGKSDERYASAAADTAAYLVNDVPRFWNGAISHRASHAEVWADSVYMSPPFLAYYAVDTNNATLLQEAAHQCRAYRNIMKANNTQPPEIEGSWHHILPSPDLVDIMPTTSDWGIWSTGNAWAAAGITRVLATIAKAPAEMQIESWRHTTFIELSGYIKEIIDGVRGAGLNDGLVRNYINDQTPQHGYGDTAGTTLIAATIYRMAVLRPAVFGRDYLDWADAVLETIAGEDKDGLAHVTPEGVVRPSVNPYNWWDTQPFNNPSPEAQAFTVNMYAAWRDCVYAGVCRAK